MNCKLLILLIFLNFNVFAEEKRIKIGVIDSGISKAQAKGKFLCEGGRKSAISFDSGFDQHGHGTNIFGLITDNLSYKTHCIISYKFWRPGMGGEESAKNVIESIRQARLDGVKFINMSLNGAESMSQEFKQVILAINAGITIFVASGNDGLNLDKSCDAYPACYKKQLKNNDRFIVVSTNNLSSSNRGKIVDFQTDGWKKGKPALSGTSQATAIISGKIISGKLKKRGKIK